jgi:type VI secretion system protein ImpI
MWILRLVRGAESAAGARTQMQLAAEGGRCVIGRDPGCDWHLPDRTLGLSARHCELASAAGRLMLRDLSTNGTFVNGASQRVQGETVLNSGDRFSAGPYQVELLFDAALAPPPAPAPAAAATPKPAAPRRGGDPAAMLGDDWDQAPGLADDAGLKTGFTRIAKPPPKASGAPAPATTAPMPLPATTPTPAPPPRPSPAVAVDWRSALTHAAGLPAGSLAGADDQALATRAGQLLRSLAEDLAQQQARRVALGLPAAHDDAAALLRALLMRE